MRRFTIASVLLCLAGCSREREAAAATRDGRWIQIAADTNAVVWMDSISLRAMGDSVAGWLRTSYRDRYRESTGRAVAENREGFVVQCRDRSLRFREGTLFDASGRAFGAMPAQDSATVVVPDSQGELIVDAACARARRR